MFTVTSRLKNTKDKNKPFSKYTLTYDNPYVKPLPTANLNQDEALHSHGPLNIYTCQYQSANTDPANPTNSTEPE